MNNFLRCLEQLQFEAFIDRGGFMACLLCAVADIFFSQIQESEGEDSSA